MSQRPRRPVNDHEMGTQPETCGTCQAWVQAQNELERAKAAAAWGREQRAIADAAERGQVFRDRPFEWLRRYAPNNLRRRP